MKIPEIYLNTEKFSTYSSVSLVGVAVHVEVVVVRVLTVLFVRNSMESVDSLYTLVDG